MPFEVGKAINSLADKLISAPIVKNIAKNPIYTALTITLIVVLIILFIFRDADTDESLFAMSLRTGFYMFIILTGGLMLHYKVLSGDTTTVAKNSEVAGVFTGEGGYSGISTNAEPVMGAFEDSIIPVQVKYEY